MIDGILGLSVAAGLVAAIFGARKAMNATVSTGLNAEGYGESDKPTPQVEEMRAEQQSAWRLILIGFTLQLVGALGLSVLAFAREL